MSLLFRYNVTLSTIPIFRALRVVTNRITSSAINIGMDKNGAMYIGSIWMASAVKLAVPSAFGMR